MAGSPVCLPAPLFLVAQLCPLCPLIALARPRKVIEDTIGRRSRLYISILFCMQAYQHNCSAKKRPIYLLRDQVAATADIHRLDNTGLSLCSLTATGESAAHTVHARNVVHLT